MAISRERFHIPELDGLRFLAFLSVLVTHAIPSRWHPAPGIVEWWAANALFSGAFGLDLFFVLSSFLITSLLLREHDQQGSIDVRAFWIRRILRIWPLYYSFVLACWAFEGLPANIVATFLLLSGNWGMLMFGLPEHSAIWPLWSVSIEEQFYLAWPLLLAWAPRRSLRPVCLSMIAAAFCMRIVILVSGGGLVQVWFNTVARLDPIALGALIALRHHERPIALGPRLRSMAGVGAALVPVALTALLTHALLAPGFAKAGYHVRGGLPIAVITSSIFLVAALCCGALVVVALAGRSWLGRPALVHLGRISYGLYVFHRLAINLVSAWWWPARLLLGFGITFVLATVSYRIVERPFLRLKTRFSYVHTDR